MNVDTRYVSETWSVAIKSSFRSYGSVCTPESHQWIEVLCTKNATNACEKFLSLIVTAHIITAAMKELGMSCISDVPGGNQIHYMSSTRNISYSAILVIALSTACGWQVSCVQQYMTHPSC